MYKINSKNKILNPYHNHNKINNNNNNNNSNNNNYLNPVKI